MSTASTVYVACPFAGTITNIYSVISGALASVNAVLTATIGGVAVTGGTVTIAFSGSAAGTVDTDATISGANTVAAGDYISIATDGASTNTVKCTVTILISRTS